MEGLPLSVWPLSAPSSLSLLDSTPCLDLFLGFLVFVVNMMLSHCVWHWRPLLSGDGLTDLVLAFHWAHTYLYGIPC